MEANTQLNERRLADAWEELHSHANNGNPLLADSNRMAFADPEFYSGARPGAFDSSSKCSSPTWDRPSKASRTPWWCTAAPGSPPRRSAQQLADAQARGDTHLIAQAERAVRNARYYDQARQFARLVAEHSNRQPQANRIYICTGGGPGIMEAANRGAHDAGASTLA